MQVQVLLSSALVQSEGDLKYHKWFGFTKLKLVLQSLVDLSNETIYNGL